MIRTLRTAHRVVWTLLALLLPGLVALALARRHGAPAGPIPPQLERPAGLR